MHAQRTLQDGSRRDQGAQTGRRGSPSAPCYAITLAPECSQLRRKLHEVLFVHPRWHPSARSRLARNCCSRTNRDVPARAVGARRATIRQDRDSSDCELPSVRRIFAAHLRHPHRRCRRRVRAPAGSRCAAACRATTAGDRGRAVGAGHRRARCARHRHAARAEPPRSHLGARLRARAGALLRDGSAAPPRGRRARRAVRRRSRCRPIAWRARIACARVRTRRRDSCRRRSATSSIAYRDGVNAGLAALSVRPFPYLLTRTTPAPWRDEDTPLVVAAMAFTLNDAENKRELAFTQMHAALPESAYRFLTAIGRRMGRADRRARARLAGDAARRRTSICARSIPRCCKMPAENDSNDAAAATASRCPARSPAARRSSPTTCISIFACRDSGFARARSIRIRAARDARST